MKRYGHLYEQMISIKNCKAAIINACHGKMKRKRVREVYENIDSYAQDLSERLQSLDFVSPYTERIIKDGLSGKERKLSVPVFYPDQCAHHAIVQILKPIITKSSYHWSCANIPKRGISHAAKGVERATKRDLKHAKYCVKLDITKFYPSIPHEMLISRLREKVKDEKAIKIIETVIHSHNPGLPIGNYTSPWLAEFYLQPLDRLIKQDCGIRHYIRYADDMVLIDNNKRKLRRAMYAVRALAESKGLRLKHDYQLFRIKYDSRRGRKIDFVGRCFARGYTTIRKRRALAFMRQSRLIQRAQSRGETIPYLTAAGFLSRCTCLRYTQSFRLKKKYLEPINIINLKEVIRDESAKRFTA